MMNQMVSLVGPLMMSHANGMQPKDMESGMGLHTGPALGEAAGPAFGRTVNLGAENERLVPNMPLHPTAQGLATNTDIQRAPNANMYPGYPQDMFMVMDDLVAKPETYGLRAGWSAGTMGMMTIIRILEPAMFDKIQQLKAEQARKADAR
jgi:hypothetical protein